MRKYNKDKRFAPPYQHKNGLKQMAQGFVETFTDTLGDIVEGAATGAIKLGIGGAKTLFGNGTNDDIRFDRQNTFNGLHPKDQFVNYQLQANLQSNNPTLRAMAAHGNGGHGSHHGLGGSTLSSANLQDLNTKSQRAISPERIGHALGHSNRCDAPIWVLDRKSNVDTVPASRRQRNAIYHSNPYTGYTADSIGDTSSPFYGADKETGLLSTLESRLYRPPNGSYTDNFPANDEHCPHCGAQGNGRNTTCWSCRKSIPR